MCARGHRHHDRCKRPVSRGPTHKEPTITSPSGSRPVSALPLSAKVNDAGLAVLCAEGEQSRRRSRRAR